MSYPMICLFHLVAINKKKINERQNDYCIEITAIFVQVPTHAARLLSDSLSIGCIGDVLRVMQHDDCVNASNRFHRR